MDEQTERPTRKGEEAGEDRLGREKRAGNHAGRLSTHGAGTSETLTANGLSQGGKASPLTTYVRHLGACKLN